MKRAHLSTHAPLIWAAAIFLLLGAASCQNKSEKPWPYYGDANTEQPAPAKTTQPTP